MSKTKPKANEVVPTDSVLAAIDRVLAKVKVPATTPIPVEETHGSSVYVIILANGKKIYGSVAKIKARFGQYKNDAWRKAKDGKWLYNDKKTRAIRRQGRNAPMKQIVLHTGLSPEDALHLEYWYQLEAHKTEPKMLLNDTIAGVQSQSHRKKIAKKVEGYHWSDERRDHNALSYQKKAQFKEWGLDLHELIRAMLDAKIPQARIAKLLGVGPCMVKSQTPAGRRRVEKLKASQQKERDIAKAKRRQKTAKK